MQKIIIDNRTVTDCELIDNGSYKPLSGFMNRDNAESVINDMRLNDGSLWALPIMLPVSKKIINSVSIGEKVALHDINDRLIAYMIIDETVKLDLDDYSHKVFGFNDKKHPGVKALHLRGSTFLSGEISNLLNDPLRGSINKKYFVKPTEIKKMIRNKNWKTVAAFNTRNPIHKAHEYMINKSLEKCDGVLLHPLVGETKIDDLSAEVRMKCYVSWIKNFKNKSRIIFGALPAAMNYSGPREVIHHMLIRKNYGCSHMIIGRDHAGVGNYYDPFEAQKIAKKFQKELNVVPINFSKIYFCFMCNKTTTGKKCGHPIEHRSNISGTKIRSIINNGKTPDSELLHPDIADIISQNNHK